MTRNTYVELCIAAILLGLALLFLNPFEFWMPGMLPMLVLGLLIAVFGTFAAFVLREHAGDEREDAHRMRAGRVAFLAGSAVLIAGIATQGLTGSIDPWLVLALSTMVILKLGMRINDDLRL